MIFANTKSMVLSVIEISSMCFPQDEEVFYIDGQALQVVTGLFFGCSTSLT
jgi:hypothetical protein